MLFAYLADERLHLWRDESFASSILIILATTIVNDESMLDANLLTTSHLIVEMHHALGVANVLFLAIKCTLVGFYLRMHGVDTQNVIVVALQFLTYKPAQTCRSARTFVNETEQIVWCLMAEYFFSVIFFPILKDMQRYEK